MYKNFLFSEKNFTSWKMVKITCQKGLDDDAYGKKVFKNIYLKHHQHFKKNVIKIFWQRNFRTVKIFTTLIKVKIFKARRE